MGAMLLRTVLVPVLAALVLAVHPARGEEPMPMPEPEASCGEGQDAGPQCGDFFGKYVDFQGKDQPAASAPADILKPAENATPAPAAPESPVKPKE